MIVRNNINYKRISIILFIFVIITISFFLTSNYLGRIENINYLVPTGNVDIFDIRCENTKSCICGNNVSNNVNNVSKNNSSSDVDTSDKPNDVPTFDESGFFVYDKYTIFGKEELKIFENPAYQYKSIIAPGSSNSYQFIIRNNNDFKVDVDFSLTEVNSYNLNLKFRLKENNAYVVGDDNNWVSVDYIKLSNISLDSKKYNAYTLDWKWEFNDNRDDVDTDIGFNIKDDYKLNINITAEGE